MTMNIPQRVVLSIFTPAITIVLAGGLFELITTPQNNWQYNPHFWHLEDFNYTWPAWLISFMFIAIIEYVLWSNLPRPIDDL